MNTKESLACLSTGFNYFNARMSEIVNYSGAFFAVASIRYEASRQQVARLVLEELYRHGDIRALFAANGVDFVPGHWLSGNRDLKARDLIAVVAMRANAWPTGNVNLLTRDFSGEVLDLVRVYQTLINSMAKRYVSGDLAVTTITPGTLKYTGGESYPLRASVTVNSEGLITGGEYDFHKLDGTMTPCTYSVSNDATCHGASNTISITSQSGLLTSSGAASPITLNAGPDSYGFIFNGTMTGTTWSGTWTNSTQIGSGTFSVDVGINVGLNVGVSTAPENAYIGHVDSFATSDQTNIQNVFRAGLIISIPKAAEYDNVTVIGLGLPGSGLKLVSRADVLSTLTMVAKSGSGQEFSTGNAYDLPSTLAPDAIPSGSTYLVRKYKGETYVGAYQLYLGKKVIAPSEMTASMFPSLAFTTYAQLCPGGMPVGGTNSTSWWSMPVTQGYTVINSHLDCQNTAALAQSHVRDSSGYLFSLMQSVWAAPVQ